MFEVHCSLLPCQAGCSSVTSPRARRRRADQDPAHAMTRSGHRHRRLEDQVCCRSAGAPRSTDHLRQTAPDILAPSVVAVFALAGLVFEFDRKPAAPTMWPPIPSSTGLAFTATPPRQAMGGYPATAGDPCRRPRHRSTPPPEPGAQGWRSVRPERLKPVRAGFAAIRMTG